MASWSSALHFRWMGWSLAHPPSFRGRGLEKRTMHVLAALLGLRILVVCVVFWVDGLVPVGPPRVAVRCRHRAACVAVE